MGEMSRNVQLIILCEDTQHESFVRRFLKKRGWPTRRLRVERASGDRGSGEQFVRERFPRELKAFRKKRHIAQALIVMIDGDKQGVDNRILALDNACKADGVSARQNDENVVIFVPTWCIETWFAYLDGQTVDETVRSYPKLKHERDCQGYVDTLAGMCANGQLRQPAPLSLQAACNEYDKKLAQLGQ